MKKYLSKISLLISVVLILIVVVSCAPQMTDEEIETELQKLTPEERAALLRDLESEKGTFVGQALYAKYTGSSSKVMTVQRTKMEAVLLRPDLIATDVKMIGNENFDNYVLSLTVKNVGLADANEFNVVAYQLHPGVNPILVMESQSSDIPVNQGIGGAGNVGYINLGVMPKAFFLEPTACEPFKLFLDNSFIDESKRNVVKEFNEVNNIYEFTICPQGEVFLGAGFP